MESIDVLDFFPISIALGIAVAVCMYFYFHYRTRAEYQQTVRTVIEKVSSSRRSFSSASASGRGCVIRTPICAGAHSRSGWA